jgi:ABC-2 type transport system ATP-binding protein
VLYEGLLGELIASATGRYDLRTTDDARAAEIAAGELTQTSDGLSFTGDERTAAELSIALGRAGVGITALVPHAPSLEELFLEMTE